MDFPRCALSLRVEKSATIRSTRFKGARQPAFLWEGDRVPIHDGARPFVDEPMIERIVSDIRSCAQCRYAAVKDTVKLADADGFASGRRNGRMSG